MSRLYVIYDERAMSGDTDSATIFSTADSIDEARKDAKMFGRGVIFSYQKHDGSTMVDDERYEEYFNYGSV